MSEIDARSLLVELTEELGAEVCVEPGDILRIRPGSRVPPEFREQLRACKPEILEILRRDPGIGWAH